MSVSKYPISNMKGLSWKDKASGNKIRYSIRQLKFAKPFRIPPVLTVELCPTPEVIQDSPASENHKNNSSKPLPKEHELSPAIKKLIIQLATSLWRINNKAKEIDESDKNVRSVRRHTEAALDALIEGKVEIKDLLGHKYIPGMALDVLAFQPDPSVQDEIISETIKPTIYYQDTLIQKGEVVVTMPKKQDQK